MIRISGLLFIAIIMVAAATPTLAQEYSVSQSVLLPPEFFVGDSVEMRLTVRVGRNETLTPPKTLPTSRWIVFHSVRVVPHGDTQEVRISFTPYHPGTLPFPAIELGHVVLKDISVYVKPVLSGRPAELQSAFRQLLLPNTRLLIGSIVGVLLVIPLLWFGFYRFGRERVAGLLKRMRENRPYRRLFKYLKNIAPRAGEMQGREFYIELLAELRHYLTRRLGTDCSALTTAEIEPHLGRLMLSEGERVQLTQIFRFGDLVKFAGRAAPVRQRKAHIEELVTIVSASATRAAEKSHGSDIVEPKSPRRRHHLRVLPQLLRRRGYVPTFHREAAPDRKERKQHVDS